MEITFEKSAGIEILKMLGLEDSRCYYCGTVITEDNLGGIFPKPSRVCCKSLSCLMEAVMPNELLT